MITTNRLNNTFSMIDNYIYLYHTDKFIVLPGYPESIQDTMTSTFDQTNPLARSAPLFTYSGSGPRTVQISLPFHREMMQQINYGVSNFNIEIGDDYVDTIIKELQSISVPRYVATQKMVNPPMVALRLGDDIFIKGIVSGAISVTYNLPILENNKYAKVDVSFQITEIDPYSAETIAREGSLRGSAAFNPTLKQYLR